MVVLLCEKKPSWTSVSILVAFFCAFAPLAMGSEAECPNFEDMSCIDSLQTRISGGDTLGATALATQQCWRNDEGNKTGAEWAKYIELQIYGCYYLNLVETINEHSDLAKAARTRASHLAANACRDGSPEICKLASGILVSVESENVSQGLSTNLNIFDIASNEPLLKQKYEIAQNGKVKNRVQLHILTPSRLVDPKKSYDPITKTHVGFLVSRIPNLSGGDEHAMRIGLQIRALEDFREGRSEVGLLLSLEETKDALVGSAKKASAETDPDGEPVPVTELKPYPFSLGLYAIYSHVFFGTREDYRKPRLGLHAGLGMVVAAPLFAPSYRLGLDAYLGYRFAASMSMVWIDSATVTSDSLTKKSARVSGGELTLSYLIH